TDGEMTLVKGGEAKAAIVWWSEDETDVTKFAASELQSYMKEISGADIPTMEVELDGNQEDVDHLSSAIVVVTGDQAEEFADQDKATIPSEWLTSSEKELDNVKEDSFTIQSE